MKNKFIPVSVFSGLLLSFIFTSCGEAPKEVVIDREITTDTLKAKVTSGLGSISANIPSPLDLTSEISGAGFNYNKGLLNSTSKASNYSTNYKKALNLGVYGADLGYVTGFKQSQDAYEYLNSIGKLSEDVGISSAFDQEMIKAIVESMSKEDTTSQTASLIKEAFQKAERNLRSHERVTTASLMITGGWIEGLHIATQVIGDTPKNEKNGALYQRVWSQIYSFTYILDLLNEYKSNPDCAKLLEELKDFEQVVGQFSKKPNLNNSDISIIREKITVARNQIVRKKEVIEF